MAKKKQAEEKPPESDPFVVQFTALVMILLAFFILLNSLANPDKRRKLMALGSLAGSFGIMPDGTGMYENGEYAVSEHPIMAGVNRSTFIRVLGTMFKGSSAAGKVNFQESATRVVLVFQSDFLFPSGVSEINPVAFPFLDDIGKAIKLMKIPVRVEGHTDSAAGKDPLSNWKISAHRAIAVLRYLRDGCGVPAKLLAAAGFADTKPVKGLARSNDPGHRRVEIVVDGVVEVWQ
jgi:chemotaxis protein MotB